jgi:hypothetical protein
LFLPLVYFFGAMGTQFAATSKVSFNNKDFSGLLDYLMHSNFWV